MMGWSLGFDTQWQRDVGYGVPAYCDHPKCNEEIDRGLAYVCGGEPYGGEKGCGLYFCGKHLRGSDEGQRCPRCAAYRAPYKRPKPDHPRWLRHKLNDPSWAQWREENPTQTVFIMIQLGLAVSPYSGLVESTCSEESRAP